MDNPDYFSEIEGAFVRRRGRNLLLSPVDWALIDAWKKQGVPLKIVLATIDDVFDQIDADPKRAGSVRTLSYCKDAVESRFRNWREGKIGSAATGAAGTAVIEAPSSEAEEESSSPDLRSRLKRLAGSLGQIADDFPGTVKETVVSTAAELDLLADDPDFNAVEVRLEALDEKIDAALLDSLPDDELAAALNAAEAKIGSRGASMDDGDFVRTRELIAKKSLRESSGIPPLGLYRL